MLVHPVVIPGSGTRSWTVLGDDDVPVAPVDRFLAYLTDIGRSPNTVKAYAHDMKGLWQFPGFRGLDWREARLEDIAEFVVWLQLPAAGRAGEVAVLPSRRARHGPTRPFMTSSCGCGRGRAWISTRTGSVTAGRRAGCATACPSRSCPSSWVTRR